jgi:hypothetical protein
MTERSWRWLRSRILSLADRPPTFFQYAVKDDGMRVALIPSTRLGYQMNPPTFE